MKTQKYEPSYTFKITFLKFVINAHEHVLTTFYCPRKKQKKVFL